GRRLEDGGHACGSSGDEEELGIVAGEVAAEPTLDRRADGGADVDRRPLVTHGATEPEGGDAGHDASEHGPLVEAGVTVVEVADVLVSSCRGGPGSQPAQGGG